MEVAPPRDRVTGRVTLDPTYRRVARDVVLGGTPLRLLRVSPAGSRALDRLEAGETGGSRSAELLAARLVTRGLAHPQPSPCEDEVAQALLTVVIPVRDRADLLEELLGDLVGFRVIIVDDASDDPLGIGALAGGFGAQLIRLEQRTGPGGARNIGARAATTELVCFLDADVRVPRGSFAPLLGHFDDPSVAAVAPRLRGPTGTSLRERFELDESPLDMGATPGQVRPASRLSYVPSAALVVRRSLTDDLFDARLLVGEDVDAIWRLAAAGWDVRFEPAAIVEHPARPSWRQWVLQRFRYGTSAAALEERHGAAVAPLRGSPWFLSGWALIVAGRPLAGLGLLLNGAPELAHALEGLVESPRLLASTIALEHTVTTAPTTARQLLRSYAPLLGAAAVVSKRARRATIGIVILAGLGRWLRSERQVDPLRFVMLSTADDLSYCAGLWTGARRARSLGALRPHVTRPAA